MTRETNLSVEFELEAMFFDESFQTTLRAIKRKIEQKKILKYASAKKEIDGREKKEHGELYKRESGSEMNAAFNAIFFVNFSLLIFAFFFFHFLAVLAVTFMNESNFDKTCKVKF